MSTLSTNLLSVRSKHSEKSWPPYDYFCLHNVVQLSFYSYALKFPTSDLIRVAHSEPMKNTIISPRIFWIQINNISLVSCPLFSENFNFLVLFHTKRWSAALTMVNSFSASVLSECFSFMDCYREDDNRQFWLLLKTVASDIQWFSDAFNDICIFQRNLRIDASQPICD